jgi:hypothetical protein
LLAILDDADADDIASFEELGDSLLGSVVRKVSEMKGEGRLVGNLLREVLTDARIASIIATTIAGSVAGGTSLARGKRLGAFGSFRLVKAEKYSSQSQRQHTRS